MEMQGYKIVPPEGMECYLDGSKIKFRPIEKPQYKDVTRFLFKDKKVYYPSCEGNICYFYCADKEQYYTDPRYGTSEKQIKKVFAINKLLNVAKYLNDGWVPDWNNPTERKYYIYPGSKGEVNVDWTIDKMHIIPFRTFDLALKAADILGEETIESIFSNY